MFKTELQIVRNLILHCQRSISETYFSRNCERFISALRNVNVLLLSLVFGDRSWKSILQGNEIAMDGSTLSLTHSDIKIIFTYFYIPFLVWTSWNERFGKCYARTIITTPTFHTYSLKKNFQAFYECHNDKYLRLGTSNAFLERNIYSFFVLFNQQFRWWISHIK